MRRNFTLALIFLTVLLSFGLVSKVESADNHTTGLELLNEAEYHSVPPAVMPHWGKLPAQVDLSGDMPPVGDQGKQLSCVGWSVAYSVRSYIEKRERKWDNTHPSRQFSPSFVYNQIARGNCSLGINFVDAFNILAEQGVATMDRMPYRESDCSVQPGEEAKHQAESFRIAGYRRVNVREPVEVKAQLAAGFPVLVAVMSDEVFDKLGKNQVWNKGGARLGSHAVAIVGYDDSKRVFKLINSWGKRWGTNGYGWIDYDFFRRVAREGYIIAVFRPQAGSPPRNVPAGPDREVDIQIGGVEYEINSTNSNPGMSVKIHYTLRGYKGHYAQVVLRFWDADGRPLAAVSPYYRDIWNNAAAGTQAFYIDSDEYLKREFTLFVPYDALNVFTGRWNWDGNRWLYQPRRTDLNLAADLFVDNFGVAQSSVEPFYVER